MAWTPCVGLQTASLSAGRSCGPQVRGRFGSFKLKLHAMVPARGLWARGFKPPNTKHGAQASAQNSGHGRTPRTPGGMALCIPGRYFNASGQGQSPNRSHKRPSPKAQTPSLRTPTLGENSSPKPTDSSLKPKNRSIKSLTHNPKLEAPSLKLHASNARNPSLETHAQIKIRTPKSV